MSLKENQRLELSCPGPSEEQEQLLEAVSSRHLLQPRLGAPGEYLQCPGTETMLESGGRDLPRKGRRRLRNKEKAMLCGGHGALRPGWTWPRTRRLSRSDTPDVFPLRWSASLGAGARIPLTQRTVCWRKCLRKIRAVATMPDRRARQELFCKKKKDLGCALDRDERLRIPERTGKRREGGGRGDEAGGAPRGREAKGDEWGYYLPQLPHRPFVCSQPPNSPLNFIYYTSSGCVRGGLLGGIGEKLIGHLMDQNQSRGGRNLNQEGKENTSPQRILFFSLFFIFFN